VKSLYCGYTKSDFGFSFVTSMPQLDRLGTQDTTVITLAPRANSGLTSFALYSGEKEVKPLPWARSRKSRRCKPCRSGHEPSPK
jgi:hypothetical protein